MLAAHHMDDVLPFFENRGMLGYSGSYRGRELAAIACGFGETATMLYAADAYALGARTFLYLGECVSQSPYLKLMDVIAAVGGSKRLLKKAQTVAKQRRIALPMERVHTNDAYWLNPETPQGYIAVDFVSAGFYQTVTSLGAEGLAIFTVSESAVTGERVEESVRQSRFHEAALLAFEILAHEQV